jgi:hypothetical protein
MSTVFFQVLRHEEKIVVRINPEAFLENFSEIFQIFRGEGQLRLRGTLII